MALSKIDVANMVTGETPVANGGPGQTTFAAAGLTRPNTKSIVVNGDMAVSQRSTSTASVSSSGYYTVDRYKFSDNSDAVLTFTQESLTSGNAYLDGFANALKADVTTVDDSLASGQNALISYAAEGLDLQTLKKGTANAETITIAFWVNATKTGTSIFEIFDNDNTRQVSKAFTISSSDTWEKKVLNFPADTTGALGDDNAVSLYFQWYLCAGSDYTSGTLSETWTGNTGANRAVGQVNHFDNTSNNFHITGFQIEVGTFSSTTIPPFQHESFGDNLARCQRYFQNLGEGTEKPLANGFFWEAQEFMAHAGLNAIMRAEPTLEYITASNYYSILRNGGTDQLDALVISGSSSRSYIRYHLASGQGVASDTKNRPGQLMPANSSSRVGVTAEL